MSRTITLLIGIWGLVATSCGGASRLTTTSSGVGATSPGADAGVDGGSSIGTDAGTSRGADAGLDAGSSIGTDAGTNGRADAGPDGGSMDGGSCLGGGCNTVAQLGQPVAVEQQGSDGPTSAGGNFVPGTYVLTAAGMYTGCPHPPQGCGGGTPTGDTMQATAVVTVSGNAVSMQLVVTKGSCVERENIDLTLLGSAGTVPTGFSATQTCPANDDGLALLVPPDCPLCTSSWSYSAGADPGWFTLYNGMSDTEDAYVSFSMCEASSTTTCVLPCQNGNGCDTCPGDAGESCGCTSYGQCVDNGCAGGCPDTNDPVCNPQTLQCVQCLSSVDCQPAGKSICVNEMCYPAQQCMTNTDCTGLGTPICDNNACVQCASDSDCPVWASHCDDNTCVECVSNSDCTSPKTCQQNACM